MPDLRDVFLCHAWDDRKEAARELYDLLNSKGVTVWFSEKDVPLGSTLLREIDKGLSKSRIGIVLVTPAFLNRISGETNLFNSEKISGVGTTRSPIRWLSGGRLSAIGLLCDNYELTDLVLVSSFLFLPGRNPFI